MSDSTVGALHRHGHRVHSHRYDESHRHLVLPQRSHPLPEPAPHRPRGARSRSGHGHSHGLVDRSIVRSRDGVKAVSISLAVLGIAAAAQTAIFVALGFGRAPRRPDPQLRRRPDGDTARDRVLPPLVPRREARRARRRARDLRLGLRRALRDDPALHPPAAAHAPLGRWPPPGVIGFVGNEIAAQVRLRAGRRLVEPRPDRRRQSRPRRRLRLARRRRQRDRRRTRACGSPTRSSASRSRSSSSSITWDSWRTVSTTEPGRDDRTPRPLAGRPPGNA